MKPVLTFLESEWLLYVTVFQAATEACHWLSREWVAATLFLVLGFLMILPLAYQPVSDCNVFLCFNPYIVCFWLSRM
jgi:uncharacterized membrane protein SirB2